MKAQTPSSDNTPLEQHESQETIKKLAQIAYEGYCQSTNWKSAITGTPLPQWDDIQKAEIRTAWEASVAAVIESFAQSSETSVTVPDAVRLEIFADRFNSLIRSLDMPAAWVAFSTELPGLGSAVTCGGDTNALQALRGVFERASGRSMNKLGVGTVPGDYRCVTCEKPLPPGKPKRQCDDCRKPDRPKLIIP